MSDINVRQAGGGRAFTMRLDADGVRLLNGKKVNTAFTWDEIERVSFEDPKRTRSNVGAIALFGALALGARTNYTLIYLSALGRAAYFEAPGLHLQFRPWINDFTQEIAASRGKLFLGDEGPGAPLPTEPVPQGGDIPAQIKALAELRDQGILSTDEFETKKADLLSRM